jgi:hypothetical protein
LWCGDTGGGERTPTSLLYEHCQFQGYLLKLDELIITEALESEITMEMKLKS